MATRRDKRWWKERWVLDHFAKLKSTEILQAHMKHKNHTNASLARVAGYERMRESGKGVTRQMISYLATGRVNSCEPDLAAAIERVLDVPQHTLFDVLPKAHAVRSPSASEALAS